MSEIKKDTNNQLDMIAHFDSNESKIQSLNKGVLLEYRIKRLFFAMGYYPKVGVIIKTSAEDEADVITDLDVYGVYIHKNFTSRRIWADCKAGKAKPLERISWIRGIRTSIKIDDVIFVKAGVRPSTKHYAKKSGILVLDLNMISKLEKDYEIKSNDWRGSWNPLIQYEQIRNMKKIVIYNGKDLKRIASFILSSYWITDEFARVKKTITGITQLGEILRLTTKKEEQMSIKWAIYELSSLFTLALLNICKGIYYLPENERNETLNDGFISGEITLSKRKEIIEATYKLANGLVKQQIPEFKPIELDTNIGLKPPKYFNKIVDLFTRITNKPLEYFDVLRIMDFTFMQYDLQELNIDRVEISELFPNYSKSEVGVKTILHFICEVCGIPKNLFGTL